jgi:tetratricopeptide (TPR) repeat protein
LKDKNAASCWYLGEHEKNSGDMEKAIEWYQKGCNINGSKGCSDLAKYELKNGKKEKAIAIYEKMCLLKPNPDKPEKLPRRHKATKRHRWLAILFVP